MLKAKVLPSLGALFFAACSARAFVVPAQRLRAPVPRVLPVASATILPAFYSTLAAGLLAKATTAATPSDASLLAATGLLSLVNLGPSDSARLTSSKRAYKNTPPASSGIAKQRRYAVKNWRSAVRIKIAGQAVGLTRMAFASSTTGVLRGAAIVMAANAAFFFVGAGKSRHDIDGKPAPMTDAASGAILAVDLTLTGTALLGAASVAGSTRRAVCSWIYAAGALIGAAEGIPAFVASLRRIGEAEEVDYTPPSEGGPTD
jgi:hypothetical protein